MAVAISRCENFRLIYLYMIYSFNCAFRRSLETLLVKVTIIVCVCELPCRLVVHWPKFACDHICFKSYAKKATLKGSKLSSFSWPSHIFINQENGRENSAKNGKFYDAIYASYVLGN